MFGSKQRARKRRQELEALRDVARHTVLFYFQSWGQGLEGRIEALNKVVAAAGINSKFEQYYVADTMQYVSGWRGPAEENERAVTFRNQLDRCFPCGSFEAEESAVMGLISATKAR